MVAFNQRERMLGAVASVVAERGYNGATVAQISDAASVSRRTFYEHFEDKEACFLATYDAVDDYLGGLLDEAVAAHAEWPDQVAAAFAELMRFLASRPDLARLYLVEAAAVGEGTIERRARAVERFIDLLRPGRERRHGSPQLAEGIEEALAGGAITLLARRVAAGQGAELAAFIPAVIEFALAPYLGPDQARALAARYA